MRHAWPGKNITRNFEKTSNELDDEKEKNFQGVFVRLPMPYALTGSDPESQEISS